MKRFLFLVFLLLTTSICFAQKESSNSIKKQISEFSNQLETAKNSAQLDRILKKIDSFKLKNPSLKKKYPSYKKLFLSISINASRLNSEDDYIKNKVEFDLDICSNPTKESCSDCVQNIIELNDAYRTESYSSLRKTLLTKAMNYDYFKDNLNQLIVIYYELALIEVNNNKRQKGLELMESLLVRIKKEKNLNSTNLSKVYNEYGLITQKTGDFKKAIVLFKKALYYSKLDKGSTISGFYFGNIGFCYYKLGNLTKALDFLEIDSKLSLITNDFSSYSNSQYLIAQIYLDQKKPSVAIALLEDELELIRVNKIFQILQNSNQELKIIELLIHTKINSNEVISNKIIDRFMSINRSINKSKDAKTNNYIELSKKIQLESFSVKLQQVKLENKIIEQKLEAESLKKNTNLFVVIALLVVISLISILIIYKINKEKVFNKMSIENKEKDLTIEQLKNSKLSESINSFENHLKMMAHSGANKVEEKNKMIEIINSSKNLSLVEKRKLKALIYDQNNTSFTEAEILNKNTELSKFDLEFETSFKVKHTQLSLEELNLCKLIALNMSDNEILTLLKMSELEILNQKNSLAEKLNLKTDLGSYLKLYFV